MSAIPERAGELTGLPHRSRKILFSLVTEYIASGQPVGSRTLSRKYELELSPASIRNVLADLEESGYLHQPHTSAGRVPTDRALRAFIQALADFEEVPASDRRALRERFEEVFATAAEPRSRVILRQAGQIVSEMAGAAAVVAASAGDTRKLQQLRFMPIKADQLLAVMVFSDGSVENRYIDTGSTETGDRPEDSELERVHNLLADVVEGRSLADLRDLFVRRLHDEQLRLDRLRQRAFELGRSALESVGEVRTGDVVIAGRARLMDLPEYENVAKIKKVVRALEDREHLVELLERTIDAGSVTVYIGEETGELGDAELSLIVAPYGDRSGGVGTVGVLGPTRMDYARLMPLVGATAAAITAAMKKSR